MANLVYYRNENEEFKEEFGRVIQTKEEVRIVVIKLLRHFKLGRFVNSVEFTSGRNHSCAGKYSITININQMNFGVVCHEVAHVYQARRLGFESGDRWHTKEHRKIMKRMIRYCEKKGWFESELKRRKEVKPEKTEPTKFELRKKKIEILELRNVDCGRKIKRYQNQIKKNHRRIGSLKRFM